MDDPHSGLTFHLVGNGIQVWITYVKRHGLLGITGAYRQTLRSLAGGRHCKSQDLVVYTPRLNQSMPEDAR